jgi:coenzyme F420-dependent glucose-6-phosphate dehydrogenase
MTAFAWMCAQEAEQPEDLLEQAVLAEAAGFDGIVTPDAFQPWSDDGAAGFTWAWLGAVAARTTSIRLIVTVSAALHRYHPAVLAQAAATIDRLSGGRFVLGMGAGLLLHEGSFGLPIPPPPERVQRLREATELVRRLLDGETVTRADGYYPVNRVHLFSPPIHRVPIWVAADGPISATVGGEVGDGLITSVKEIQRTRTRVIEPYRRAASGRGAGDTPILATRWCILAKDDEEAWKALGPLRGLRADGKDEAYDPRELRRQAESMDRDELLGRFALVRDAEGLIDLYRPLVADLGADWVALQVRSLDPLGTIRLAGETVLPALRAAGADRTIKESALRRKERMATQDGMGTGGGNDGDEEN